LRARLHELEERLRNVEAATSGEIRELKAALAKAESALEASKLERARSAVETMKHWRQHRREVEKLRDDQGALMASVGDLRAVRAEADKLRAERDAATSRVAALEAQLAKGKR
jgi:chromosome segregation ATPase